MSAGNLYFDQLAPQAQLFGHWPGYLCDDGYEIVDPAQAALAITVGAVAHHDAPSDGARYLEVVATAGGPAPFTRHGPGVSKAIKPELAADGGNWVFDRQKAVCVPDHAVEVLSSSNRYPDELFGANIGKHEVKLQPAVTIRRRGTNQFAHRDWSQRLSSGVDGDWFMVVRSLNKWLRPSHGLQRYALAVTIEVDRADRLYGELEIALRAQARTRGRAEARLGG